jgi:hypothetical protein
MGVKTNFLEEVGVVKTARREAESLLLLRAILNKQSLCPTDHERFLELSRLNKVVLRATSTLNISPKIVSESNASAEEAMKLYELVSSTLEEEGISFAVIKSFDSLPDIGHDLDFLITSSTDFRRARDILVNKFKVKVEGVTFCDMVVGKFSCFLPGFKHDFELYPTVSQLGEEHLDTREVMTNRKTSYVSGRQVWLTSDVDRVIIRVIHAMFRHNFLKLSDVLDFITLTRDCSSSEIMDAVDRAGIGDAFIFFLSTLDRFLKASQYDYPKLDALRTDAEHRFGRDRLGPLRRDRLVLPYRIPTFALLILFLLKAGREASRGRLKSALMCLFAPPLLLMDFGANALSGHRLW